MKHIILVLAISLLFFSASYAFFTAISAIQEDRERIFATGLGGKK